MRFGPIGRTISLRALVALLMVVAAVLAGCSSDSLKNASATDPKAAGVGGVPNTDVECPSMQVRNGASTWQTPPGGSTTDLRYQASLGQMARECALLGDTMTIKVGVEGPGAGRAQGRARQYRGTAPARTGAGRPASEIDLDEILCGAGQFAAGQSGTPFTHVEDDLTFAMPPSKDITAYVIYVGFDPQGLNARKKKTPAHKAAPKAQAKKKAPPPVASGGFAPPAQGGFAPPGGGGFAPPPGQFSPPPANQ